MFPLLPKGDLTKLLKFLWLKIFSICHRCRWHRWQTFSCQYLREFSKKFETVWKEYSGAGGKLIHEKNQKQKISWHCPFKVDRRHTGSLRKRDNLLWKRGEGGRGGAQSYDGEKIWSSTIHSILSGKYFMCNCALYSKINSIFSFQVFILFFWFFEEECF